MGIAKKIGPNPFERPLPVTEHGFSVLIRVKQGDKDSRVLFDAGVCRRGLLYTFDTPEFIASDVRAIIIRNA